MYGWLLGALALSIVSISSVVVFKWRNVYPERRSDSIALALLLAVSTYFAQIVIASALTILLAAAIHDAFFIKIRPTVICVVFASVLLISVAVGRPLLAYGFNRILKMTDSGWKTITSRWSVFYLFLALANEVVWRSQSLEIWRSFLPAAFILGSFVFSFSQIPLILRSEALR